MFIVWSNGKPSTVENCCQKYREAQNAWKQSAEGSFQTAQFSSECNIFVMESARRKLAIFTYTEGRNSEKRSQSWKILSWKISTKWNSWMINDEWRIELSSFFFFFGYICNIWLRIIFFTRKKNTMMERIVPIRIPFSLVKKFSQWYTVRVHFR